MEFFNSTGRTFHVQVGSNAVAGCWPTYLRYAKRVTRRSQEDGPATPSNNYITPGGLQRLKDEHRFLLTRERPAVTEVVAWAASNGDRSENADYQYGKRRLRQIDGRIRFLTKRIEAAEVVDPETPRAGQAATRAFFGATVRYANAAGTERVVSIVGSDEDLSPPCNERRPRSGAILLRSLREDLPRPPIQVVHGTFPPKCARSTLQARSGILCRPGRGEPRDRPLPTSSMRTPEATPN